MSSDVPPWRTSCDSDRDGSIAYAMILPIFNILLLTYVFNVFFSSFFSYQDSLMCWYGVGTYLELGMEHTLHYTSIFHSPLGLFQSIRANYASHSTYHRIRFDFFGSRRWRRPLRILCQMNCRNRPKSCAISMTLKFVQIYSHKTVCAVCVLFLSLSLTRRSLLRLC